MNSRGLYNGQYGDFAENKFRGASSCGKRFGPDVVGNDVTARVEENFVGKIRLGK